MTASTRMTAVLVTTSSTVRNRSRAGALVEGCWYIWSRYSALGAAVSCALMTFSMFLKAGLLLVLGTVTSDEADGYWYGLRDEPNRRRSPKDHDHQPSIPCNAGVVT